MEKTRREFTPEFKREAVAAAGELRLTADAGCGRSRDLALHVAAVMGRAEPDLGPHRGRQARRGLATKPSRVPVRSARPYIEGYYNRQRIHSAIGYLTPEQAERTAS